MTNLKWNRIFLAVVLLGALALTACTRSASNNPVPTQPPADASGTDVFAGESDPTMEALGTQVSVQMTETAVAVTGSNVEAGPPTETPTPLGEVPTAAPVVQSTPVSVLPTATPAAVVLGCASPYTVKQGDWIYKIARDCQVDPQALLAANPGINPDYIKPGQSLNIPAAGAAPSAACTGTHTVLQGETLFRLSYACGLTVEQLAATNGIAYPYLLHPGDIIRYP